MLTINSNKMKTTFVLTSEHLIALAIMDPMTIEFVKFLIKKKGYDEFLAHALENCPGDPHHTKIFIEAIHYGVIEVPIKHVDPILN